MPYDNPQSITYQLGMHDYGTAGEATAIKPPPGKRFGRVKDIHVACTETFNAVTTQAKVEVGTSGDADKFAILNIGTLADTDGLSPTAAQLATFPVIDLTAEGISQLEVVLTAPTGGTPAGMGYTTIAVDWW